MGVVKQVTKLQFVSDISQLPYILTLKTVPFLENQFATTQTLSTGVSPMHVDNKAIYCVTNGPIK